MTNEIIELVDSLPLIMSYVVYGAVFIWVYRFVRRKESSSDVKNYLVLCVSASFIIKNIYILALRLISPYGPLLMAENTVAYFLMGTIFSVITAYFCGIVCNADWFNKLLLAIGIQRTTNTNIWVDILKPHTWLYIHLKGKDYAYMGEHEYSEENKSSPKIVLRNYVLFELSTGKNVTDYSDAPNRKIMIDTSSVDIIEIIYENRTPSSDDEKDSFTNSLKTILSK